MGVRKAAVSVDPSSGILRRARRRVWQLTGYGLAIGLCASSALAVDLASVSIGGNSGNAASNGVAVSNDGSVVAFFSDATNLVVNDTNQKRDVFVRDFNAGTTERVSVSTAGVQANLASHAAGGSPAISGDGDVVAFYSDATNLVPSDTNGVPDVFVHVRSTGTTERVSVAGDGSQANGPSTAPSISADGRFVAFQSQATNLVPDDTNNASDIFVRDRLNGTTERVCGAVQGNRFSFSPAISADGNFVAFASAATNLVPGDTNAHLDIFVCNRGTGAIERVSVNSNGEQGNGDSILPAISGDGGVVAFKSLADNLVAGDDNNVVDVFARDRGAGTTERISNNRVGGDANDFSFPPSVSRDGRFVAFGSFATNLVDVDNNTSSDVFVRDRQIKVTLLVDVNDRGEQANGGTPDAPPSISGDGKKIGFVSAASNLVNNDRNETLDVFVGPNPFFGPGRCPDGSCPAGQSCVQGVCLANTPTPTVTNTAKPTRTGTPTLTPTPTPTFKTCVEDTDCNPDQHCRGGTCKKERPCDDANPAVDRLACFDREACVNSLCECGGDCNLDGFVFVNEINKAVKILNNLQPVSQCIAADIDGDGQVMGNEITLAVINLGQGCTQEGRPLIFSHSRGGMVTFAIGAVAGAPGDTVSVPIDISGGQGEVASAQLDLLFDASALAMDDPGTACVKDPRLTEHVFSSILTDAPPAPSGLQRLRLFIGDITPPVATFDDGHIITCAFQVKASAAPQQLALAADRLNVGDQHGDVFGSQAVSGGVSILVPTPTPAAPSSHPFCPGDCDGDGQVLVNEITVGVRIMAGEIPLSECPAADADGDGEVFVTDISRAVISLGNGCPQ